MDGHKPSRSEIRRAITLHLVEFISREKYESDVVFSFPPPLRYVRWEVTKDQARQIIIDLQSQLDLNPPGKLSIMGKGTLDI